MKQYLGMGALAAALFASVPANANDITDVGVGPAPDFDPSHGTTWTLSSTCIDINEAGEAACQARAVGPTYRCGFRGAQRCSSKVYHVYRWDDAGLMLMSDPAAGNDVPLVINNHGDIGGYNYGGAVYPSGGGNGRIWIDPETPQALASPVVSLNDAGDYILQSASSSGGVTQYGGTAHEADGTAIPLAGVFVRPFVLGNEGHIIGAQIIQSYVSELSSPTGDEIPEVSGVGRVLDQDEIDALELNEEGLYDIDGDVLWPGTYYRPIGFTSYTTTATDVNDHGDFVFRYNFGGLYQGRYCTPDGKTRNPAATGGTGVLPWKCVGTDYNGGTYAGGKAFHGINNRGDAVGVFTPGVYAYQSTYTTHPWVWLRNAAGGRDEYDANDLLSAGSGYTVLSVNDINDQREIVGTCETAAGETRGCILHVTEPAIPEDTIKPFVRIDAPKNGKVVSGKVALRATALDDWSRIKKVVFKVDGVRIRIDKTAPFKARWDTSGFAPGDHTIKVVAQDNAGNRRTKKVVVTIADPNI